MGKNKKKALPNSDGQDKWYPYVKSLGTITEKEVARQIAERTALNPKEVEMALSLQEEVVLKNLLEGKNVMPGDWPFFTLLLSVKDLYLRKKLLRQKYEV